MTERWVSGKKQWCAACRIFVDARAGSLRKHELSERHQSCSARQVIRGRKEKAQNAAAETEMRIQIAQIEQAALARQHREVFAPVPEFESALDAKKNRKRHVHSSSVPAPKLAKPDSAPTPPVEDHSSTLPPKETVHMAPREPIAYWKIPETQRDSDDEDDEEEEEVKAVAPPPGIKIKPPPGIKAPTVQGQLPLEPPPINPNINAQTGMGKWKVVEERELSDSEPDNAGNTLESESTSASNSTAPSGVRSTFLSRSSLEAEKPQESKPLSLSFATKANKKSKKKIPTLFSAE